MQQRRQQNASTNSGLIALDCQAKLGSKPNHLFVDGNRPNRNFINALQKAVHGVCFENRSRTVCAFELVRRVGADAVHCGLGLMGRDGCNGLRMTRG